MRGLGREPDTRIQKLTSRSLNEFGVCAVLLAMVGAPQLGAAPIIPFAATGDLFVVDDRSDSILRVTPGGTVSLAVTEAQIVAATGALTADLGDSGIAFGGTDGRTMFFTDEETRSVLKLTEGLLSVFVTESDITAVTGNVSARPQGVAVDGNGFLFVTDTLADSLLRVNPTTANVILRTSEADFETLPGILAANLTPGIVATPSGKILTLNEGEPSSKSTLPAHHRISSPQTWAILKRLR